MEIKKIESSPAQDAPVDRVLDRKEYDKANISNRPSYSPVNAEQFRGVFDDMMRTGTNRVIDSNLVGLKPATLYLKAQDALKWLSENDKDGEKYAVLRTRISIRRRTDGILIYFKPSVANIISKATSVAGNQTTWKDDFIKWFQTAQPTDIFEHKEICVTPEEKQWLLSLLSTVDGIEADIGPTHVKIMR